MVYKSDDLWAAGRPEPPQKQQVYDFLKQNSDDYFTPGQVAEPVFDLDPVEEMFKQSQEQDGIPVDHNLILNERFRVLLRTELLLERLVEEGKVAKRSIRISDQMDALREENPEIADSIDERMEDEYGDELPDEYPGRSDFSGTRSTFYKYAEDFE
jgi:hypothetical protein